MHRRCVIDASSMPSSMTVSMRRRCLANCNPPTGDRRPTTTTTVDDGRRDDEDDSRDCDDEDVNGTN
eukprot:6746128-Pyramimonas_sp.AAC.1